MQQNLSKNDEDILSRIFNPDEGFAVVENEENSTKINYEEKIDKNILTQIKHDELKAIEFIKNNEFSKGLNIFNKIIETCSTYASVYNNRANYFRMVNKLDEALLDLNLAIEYGGGQKLLLGNAYTQRGLIKKELKDELGAELDFLEGAKFGNDLAKLEVKNNPYAKL
ncbi:Tetratricopeptide repeat protein 36 [Clydaea vesicula]|uniref:Tetratricopeptide repeat protein 36 n=1 Tax=Clydaea vesicula TaxID=447962 RepID=A0AAD5TXK7_9FUNG|nr:Tetratricopeptide repeat protein 36 [Clydaea vesicula]